MAPGAIWLIVLFVLPFYVVFAVAFGSINFDFFGTAVPYYAPWWWSFDTFNQTLSQFYVGTHIYQAPLIRTFEYVFPPASSAWSSGTRSRTTRPGSPRSTKGSS